MSLPSVTKRETYSQPGSHHQQVQATEPADIISLNNVHLRHNINEVEYSPEELEKQQQFGSNDASMYQHVNLYPGDNNKSICP